MRPYRRRRRPINENELVRDLHRVCRYVLGKHPVKHAPPSRVRYAAQMVLRYVRETHGCPALAGACHPSPARARGRVRLGDG